MSYLVYTIIGGVIGWFAKFVVEYIFTSGFDCGQLYYMKKRSGMGI